MNKNIVLRKSIPKTEPRTLQRIRAHYEIEKELASRLRNAGREERKYLYTSLYDELFQRVPDHSLLTNKNDSNLHSKKHVRQLGKINRFLKPHITVLELGSGDCKLAFEVAKRVRKVYAIDVSTIITANLDMPENCELLISDGCSVPVPKESVDLAYSNQLMEHLHPDDAIQQLQNVYNALAPGGIYICITPNRITGPHDISKYFDEIATGFHLKEYTYTELVTMMKIAGFSKVYVLLTRKGFQIPFSSPVFVFQWLEYAPIKPSNALSRLLKQPPLKWLLNNINLIATK